MANLFPRSSNFIPLKIIFSVGVILVLIVSGITYYFTNKYTNVGYQPTQPIPFDHSLHAGQLGMDCRYCHSFVEGGAVSNVPTTQTCMNCHWDVRKDSPKLEPLRESWATGKPLKWVKIHQAPDYVYFNHSVHISRGVGCVSCHGKVNEMTVVFQDQPQSMGWCLECHRNPEKFIRPVDKVFDLNWQPAGGASQQEALGRELVNKWKVAPPQNCAACHR